VPRQEASEEDCTSKGAEYTGWPVPSRSISVREVPAGISTSQVTLELVKVPMFSMAPALTCPPGRTDMMKGGLLVYVHVRRTGLHWTAEAGVII